MSWSLALRHGDFQVDQARMGTVTRKNKLVQDLKCAIMERMGTDNLHPTFGSLIDGGRTPDGQEYPGVIGLRDIDLATMEIESEIARIVRQHQQVQLNRAKSDKIQYGRATLDPGEIVVELSDIQFIQNQDKLSVTIRLVTAADDQLNLELPIQIDLTEL